jgi:hypothetical protein
VKKIMDSAPPERKRLDCRQEAQSIRAMARDMKHPKIREQLLLIASLYDKLADISEQADRAVPLLAVDCTTGRPDAV